MFSIASLASKSIVSLASLVPQKDFSACFANQLNFRLGSTKVPLILPNKDTTYQFLDPCTLLRNSHQKDECVSRQNVYRTTTLRSFLKVRSRAARVYCDAKMQYKTYISICRLGNFRNYETKRVHISPQAPFLHHKQGIGPPGRGPQRAGPAVRNSGPLPARRAKN